MRKIKQRMLACIICVVVLTSYVMPANGSQWGQTVAKNDAVITASAQGKNQSGV